MDIRKVKKLIELIESSSITDIEIREGEESVRISRAGPTPLAPPAATPGAVVGAAPAASAAESPAAAPRRAAGDTVNSPMVGTFYRAASPESPPFVEVGSTVKVGDTLCIIEAMKILNTIEAESAGTIADVLVDNGEPVEYDQALFVITP